MVKIDGKTMTCGLLGNPVEHTMSPAIHNTLAELQRMSWMPKNFLRRVFLFGSLVLFPQSVLYHLAFLLQNLENIGVFFGLLD